MTTDSDISAERPALKWQLGIELFQTTGNRSSESPPFFYSRPDSAAGAQTAVRESLSDVCLRNVNNQSGHR
jgi:hypothetical protein